MAQFWRGHQRLLAALFLLGLVALFMGDTLFPAGGQALAGHDIQSQFLPWLSQAGAAMWLTWN